MSRFSDREAVELFHLHFVRVLFAGKEKHAFPINGGCNLRFFFGSVRYSEDLDLDVTQSSGTRSRSGSTQS